jgi:hypothetical protein
VVRHPFGLRQVTDAVEGVGKPAGQPAVLGRAGRGPGDGTGGRLSHADCGCCAPVTSDVSLHRRPPCHIALQQSLTPGRPRLTPARSVGDDIVVVRPRRRGPPIKESLPQSGRAVLPERIGSQAQPSEQLQVDSSRESLSRCSTPAVAVLHFPVTGAVSARRTCAGPTGTAPDVRRTNRNAMKPRIQCVPTQWMPGSMASGSGPSFMAPAPPSRSAAGGGLGRRSTTARARGTRRRPSINPAGPWIARLRLVPVDAEFCRFLQTAYCRGLRYDGMWTVY